MFNSDWTCRGFQFEVGKTFTEDVKPVCCSKGFHFCTKAIDCFKHYDFSLDCKVAEVEALGEVDTSGSKCCTNKIRIVREVTWHELLDMVNTGRGCTGLGNSGNYNSGNYNSGIRNSGNYNSGNYNSGSHNSGNYNSGNYNSGSYNSGSHNSGDYNSGSYNSGNYNSGNYNSGSYNSGSHNSGDYNSGDYNSGDWNDTNYSNGCFNTLEPKIYMFNKPTDWTYQDWRSSDAGYYMDRLQKNVTWISLADMTDQEKKAHPEAETTRGYLKSLNKREYAVKQWRLLSPQEKRAIMELPNFDKEIFKQITGIDVERW